MKRRFRSTGFFNPCIPAPQKDARVKNRCYFSGGAITSKPTSHRWNSSAIGVLVRRMSKTAGNAARMAALSIELNNAKKTVD
jgi:hypothetical protein